MSQAASQLPCAYYLLAARTPKLEEIRSGAATRFPLHFTVRGRFIPSLLVESREQLADAGKQAFEGIKRFRATVTGPVVIRPDLVWYEPVSESIGQGLIGEAHQRIEGELSRRRMISSDMTPREHKGLGFRPHLTVALGECISTSTTGWPGAAEVTVDRWGVFRYRMEQSGVRLVRIYEGRLQE